MARQLRLDYPGALHHVTARGNAQQPIFLDDADRHRFRTLLGQETLQQHWRCYAFCLRFESEWSPWSTERASPISRVLKPPRPA